MQLGVPRRAVRQSHLGKTFAFPPAPASIQLSKPHNLANGTTGSECLYTGDLPNDFEIHSSIVSEDYDRVNLTCNNVLSGARDHVNSDTIAGKPLTLPRARSN